MASKTDSAPQRIFDKKEWPTVLLSAAVYLLWFLLTWYHSWIPLPLLIVLGAISLAWYASFQHECVHYHPTRIGWLNDLIGFVPLMLYLPYIVYRDTHRAHHNEEILSIPGVDPESFYVSAATWKRLGPIARGYLSLRNSLAGRLLLGPFEVIIRSFLDLIRDFATLNIRMMTVWICHILGVAAVLYWVMVICNMPFWLYALAFVYPGIALMLLRSYCEHKSSVVPAHRTVIVRASPFFKLLYLNNSLHMVHHMNPAMPWYELQGEYDGKREFYDARTGGFVFSGYWPIIRDYLFRPLDHSVFEIKK